jgi:hypothetical protein
MTGCPFLGFGGKTVLMISMRFASHLNDWLSRYSPECDGHHAALDRFGGDFQRGDDRHMEPKMAYFILFLFVAYVAPVFFLKGIELYAANHSAEAASPPVEQEKPAEDSQKSLVNA